MYCAHSLCVWNKLLSLYGSALFYSIGELSDEEKIDN